MSLESRAFLNNIQRMLVLAVWILLKSKQLPFRFVNNFLK